MEDKMLIIEVDITQKYCTLQRGFRPYLMCRIKELLEEDDSSCNRKTCPLKKGVILKVKEE